MVLLRLALSNFSVHKFRVALTIAAIALSVSLVISVTSGYASAESAAYKFLSQYIGSHDAQITRGGDPRAGLRETICDELLADPEVKTVTRRVEMQSGLLDTTGKAILGRPATITGIRRPGDQRVENMQMHEGNWFDGDSGDVAVIDQAAARIIKSPDPKLNIDTAPSLHVGDSFVLPGIRGNLTLRIVGIVHKPAILANITPTVYVPLKTLQKFAMPDQPPQVTRMMIDLKDGVDAGQFRARWTARLATEDPLARIRLASDNKNQLDQNLKGIHILSYLGGMVSMTAATFIVFSALSMGVSERQRSLAMLRAIGAFKSHLGWLVILEGMALAVGGVIVGVPLGVFFTRIIVWRFHELFAAGITLSWPGIAMASIGSVLAALAASFLPAWSAMRVSPLEAMTPLAESTSMRSPILAAIGGLLLISLDPFLMFGPLPRNIVFYGHFLVGLPGIMIGYFLLAPMLVWLMENLAGPPVAAMFGVRFPILKQQLSGGLWRAAGTCAALMVGLAILVVLQVQGRTMLNGWRLPDKFPDIFLFSYQFNGLNAEEQQKLAKVPGIRAGDLMPIAMASPEFGNNIFAISGSTLIPNATLFLGVDPEQALRMMELEFRDPHGRPYDKKENEHATQQAIAMLKLGRHLIVPQEFHQLKGLNTGDKISLMTPKHGMVDYTIAGVVWSPGLDVIEGIYDMGRQMDQRTAASVFGSLDDAREDFGVEGIYLFAANLDTGVDKDQLLKQVQQAVGVLGMRAGDVRQIKAEMQEGFGRILLLISTVAFCAMAVASLGVTNTIMASIRSRRWQFGILRSIGVTRDGLLRLILAEATLLGVAGCALGLAAGLQMSIDARKLSLIVIGYDPPTTIPWGIITIGVVIVMLVALLASIGPAISTARREPLELLQAGRAAT